MRAKLFRQYNASRSNVRAVGSFVPDITKRAFQKYGFSAATILTDWPDIIGKDLASVTRPERLKWPRNPEILTGSKEACRRHGATLVLRTEPSRALDIQYQCSTIKDRINAYFGYCAVFEIRLLQAPVAETPIEEASFRQAMAPEARYSMKKPGPANTMPLVPPHCENATREDRLQYALTRLEHNILGEVERQS